ncbi:ribonuclease-like [Chelydra serpentina]|uniref:Ribonuclease-like n=1 Tax=Chelydra serpentina TaxID=8475 RepID=A0A8T1S236_CHESE|nr:ribonuclease-like [Chelydra serpentina]
MAPRGPRLALLLPLIQLTVCLALASGQSCRDRNYRFRWNHVDIRRLSHTRHNSYCNMRMKKMSIYEKAVNTFIHAPSEAVNFICMGGGIRIPPDLLRSKRYFKLTTCTYNKSLSYTGRYHRRQIVVRCCHRLATYLQE